MLKSILAIVLGIILVLGGIGHLADPEMSSGFIPDFLPKMLVHIVTAIVEIGLGIAAFIPQTRKMAMKGVFVLMLLFLPLHVMDLFRENPIIGSMTAAVVRVPIQFLLIFMAWYAGRK